MDSCSDAWLPTRMPGEMRGCQNGSHEREEKGKGEARGQLYEANRATVPHLVFSTGRRYRYLYDSYTITIPIHSTDSGVWNLPYKESRTRKEESVHAYLLCNDAMCDLHVHFHCSRMIARVTLSSIIPITPSYHHRHRHRHR
ncbi:hypothetical protein IAQ61_004581, partial [Plenodomus lingam]|uniref:uncharacterized protein n=1 Tax=Leptosphaeria maculans TaxID=5022 RepID=UPI0033211597